MQNKGLLNRQSKKYYIITRTKECKKCQQCKMSRAQNFHHSAIQRLSSPYIIWIIFTLHVSCGMPFIKISWIIPKQGGGEARGSVNLFPVSLLLLQWKGWDTASVVVAIPQLHLGPWTTPTTADRQPALWLRCCCCCIVVVWAQVFVGMTGAGTRRRSPLQRYFIVCDSSVHCAGAFNANLRWQTQNDNIRW